MEILHHNCKNSKYQKNHSRLKRNLPSWKGRGVPRENFLEAGIGSELLISTYSCALALVPKGLQVYLRKRELKDSNLSARPAQSESHLHLAFGRRKEKLFMGILALHPIYLWSACSGDLPKKKKPNNPFLKGESHCPFVYFCCCCLCF